MKKIDFIVLLVFLVLWAEPAMAYIDPGSGSAVMSAIIGIFVAVGLAVKTYWYKIKSLLFGKKRNKRDKLGQKPEDNK